MQKNIFYIRHVLDLYEITISKVNITVHHFFSLNPETVTIMNSGWIFKDDTGLTWYVLDA